MPAKERRNSGTPTIASKRAIAAPEHDERLLPIYNSPGHVIRRVHRMLVSVYEADMGPTGLTAPQFTILWTIELVPDLEQSEIATLVNSDPATAGAVIGHLADRNLVIRQRSTRSRRGWTVRLTPTGAQMMTRARQALRRLERRLRQRLGSDDFETFMRLTSKLTGVENKYTAGHSRSGPLRRATSSKPDDAL